MRTAEQIAQICGVSPQAVREWCKKNGVKKGAKGRFLFDTSTECRIFEHYGVDVAQLAQDKQQASTRQDKQVDTLIEMLHEELEAKNRQLEEKDRQIERLQIALDQQQKLTAMQEQKLLECNLKHEEEITKKRHWWQFGK